MSILVKGGELIEPTPGISNLIAKTLMKGTANRNSDEISRELLNSGIIISPSSNPDYFEIQVKSTTSDFNKAFDILSDIIENPVFNPADVEKAKKDIILDIQESRDTPSSLAFEEFERAMYPNHPYGYVGAVIEKNMPTITRDNVLTFYKESFIPQNMVVSVSGNVNNKDLIDKFSKFTSDPSGKVINIENLKNQYKALTQGEFVPVVKTTSSAWEILGWPVSGISEMKDFASLKILNSILGSGMSSRLFIDLREKQGLAYEISSVYPTRLDSSFFVMYMGTDPKNLSIAKNGFLKEINKIKIDPISDKELIEAKQKLIGQFALSQETNQEKAHSLGWFEVLGKGYKFNYEYPDIINSVTVSDVMNAANKYFNNPYIMTVVGPDVDVKEVKGI